MGMGQRESSGVAVPDGPETPRSRGGMAAEGSAVAGAALYVLLPFPPPLPPQAIMKDKDTWIGEHATQIDRPGGAHAAKTGTR